MPTFNDSENIPALLPEGDYIYCVVDFECGISNTSSTNGADKYEMRVAIEPSGKKITERLIDHPNCNWKIDTFIKSADIKLDKGEAYEFRKDKAESQKVRWIDPEGLRGWCRVIVDNYEKDGKKKQANKIGTFYVDKPKLPRKEIERPF